MIKVAIVGNIASGKSTVETILKDKGFKVFDTDKIAHKILEKNEDVKNTFKTTDRKELAQIVFSNPEQLKLLESIIHPEVKKELQSIFSEADSIVFVSVPQLFETGFDKMFDKIIYITADQNIRLERLKNRNELSTEEALKRIQAQSEEGKAEKSDFVIINNLDLVNLNLQVEKILSILIG